MLKNDRSSNFFDLSFLALYTHSLYTLKKINLQIFSIYRF